MTFPLSPAKPDDTSRYPVGRKAGHMVRHSQWCIVGFLDMLGHSPKITISDHPSYLPKEQPLTSWILNPDLSGFYTSVYNNH